MKAIKLLAVFSLSVVSSLSAHAENLDLQSAKIITCNSPEGFYPHHVGQFRFVLNDFLSTAKERIFHYMIRNRMNASEPLRHEYFDSLVDLTVVNNRGEGLSLKITPMGRDSWNLSFTVTKSDSISGRVTEIDLPSIGTKTTCSVEY